MAYEKVWQEWFGRSVKIVSKLSVIENKGESINGI